MTRVSVSIFLRVVLFPVSGELSGMLSVDTRPFCLTPRPDSVPAVRNTNLWLSYWQCTKTGMEELYTWESLDSTTRNSDYCDPDRRVCPAPLRPKGRSDVAKGTLRGRPA
jgi:hypothetical protein